MAQITIRHLTIERLFWIAFEPEHVTAIASLSWLEFNQRVLDEALDNPIPPRTAQVLHHCHLQSLRILPGARGRLKQRMAERQETAA